MLECYLDDSGTHDVSRVLVWGGIAGDKNAFFKLDEEWKVRLQNPCEGRPPIKAFHSFDLAAGRGEFLGYNEAERNLTRWNFRKIIIDCELTFISYGVSLDAWSKVTAENEVLAETFTAEGFVFAAAVKNICESAMVHGEPISFQIDEGRLSPELAINIKIAIEKAQTPEQFVSYTFSPVKAVPGLQAADLVAHETYQFYVRRLDDPNSAPSVHLQRLTEGVHDFRDGWFGEEELCSMVKKAQGKINWSLSETDSSGQA